jgi:hypothetical protein
MSMQCRSLFVVVVLLALVGCGGRGLPPKARTVLDAPDEFELLSLNPDHEARSKGSAGSKGETFHDWPVLGKTKVTEADRKRVMEALERGIGENNGMAAACFNPRHGIRATKGGKTVELEICFECMSMTIYVDGERKGALTTGSPQKTFDEVLIAAGVKLADKADH